MGPNVSFSSLKEDELKNARLVLMRPEDTLNIIAMEIIQIQVDLILSIIMKLVLSRLSLLGAVYNCGTGPAYTFALTHKAARSPITQDHIHKSASVVQLISTVELYKLTEHPQFRPFMRKLTSLLLTDKLDNPQSISCIERLLYELRRFSSAEMHSNTSDLLNYQLLFKQLTRLMPKLYYSKGFEIRATMVAESIPFTASFDGGEPATVALLHYMSTLSQLSKNQLKKNILNYFIRCNLTRKINQSAQIAQKSTTKKQQPLNFDVDSLAILLSCSESRPTNTVLQNSIESVALYNLNKRMHKVRDLFNLKQVREVYFKYFHERDSYKISQQELLGIRQEICKNKVLSEFKDRNNDDDSPRLVLNTQERLLQATDVLVRMLKKDQKNIIINEISYKAVNDMTEYFHTIFFLSQGMKILVSTQRDQHQRWYAQGQVQPQPSKGQVKEVSLLKIGVQLLEAFLSKRIYVNGAKPFCNLLTHRLVLFIGQYLPGPKGSGKPVSEIQQRLWPALVKMLTLLPISALEQESKNQPATCKFIGQFIIKLVQKLPFALDLRNEIVSKLIQVLKFKKDLYLGKNQWADVMKTVIKQDNELSLWQLYFFLGSTEDPELHSLIPFPKIIQQISRQRGQLDRAKKYRSPESMLEEGEKDQSKIIELATASRNWQILILRLHALAILVGKESKLQKWLSQHCVDYKIGVEEIQSLFAMWLSPYKQALLYNLYNLAPQQKQTNEKLSEIDLESKPLSIFGNYFFFIFLSTKCYYQFKLINKIINHSKFQSYLSNSSTLTNRNFFPHFFVLILGLGDPENRRKYMEKYPVSKIIPDDIRVHTIFNCKFINLAPEFVAPEQWDYYFTCLIKFECLMLCKEFYSDYIPLQQIYLQSCASSSHSQGSKWLTQGKYSPSMHLGISKKIIKKILLQLHTAYANSANVRRLAYAVNYIYELACLNHQNYALDVSKFVDEDQALKINRLLCVKNLTDQLELPIIVFKLKLLGILKIQSVVYILQNLHFKRKIDITKLMCLTTLGKERCLAEGFIQEGDWQATEHEAYKISTQIGSSAMWLLTIIQFGNTSRFFDLKRYSQKLYHPVERKIVLQYLKAMQKVHNIDVSQIKEQSADINQGDNENEQELQEQNPFSPLADLAYSEQKEQKKKKEEEHEKMKVKNALFLKKQNDIMKQQNNQGNKKQAQESVKKEGMFKHLQKKK